MTEPKAKGVNHNQKIMSQWQHQGRLMYGTPNISRTATVNHNQPIEESITKIERTSRCDKTIRTEIRSHTRNWTYYATQVTTTRYAKLDKQIWSSVTDDACKILGHSLVTARLDYANSLLYNLPQTTLPGLAAVRKIRPHHSSAAAFGLVTGLWAPDVQCTCVWLLGDA